MIRIACDKCGKDITTEFRWRTLLRGILELGLENNVWRVAAIDHEIWDGHPSDSEEPASGDEISHIKQLHHELMHYLLWPVFCLECSETEVEVWAPDSGEPCPIKESLEEKWGRFQISEDGKKKREK